MHKPSNANVLPNGNNWFPEPSLWTASLPCLKEPKENRHGNRQRAEPIYRQRHRTARHLFLGRQYPPRLPTNGIIFMYADGRKTHPKDTCSGLIRTVFHATSDKLTGPYHIQNSIGKGHNPEAFRLDDGRIVVYVIDGYYIATNEDSPIWYYQKFDFDPRDRPIIEGLSNLTFARRQDGSRLMVCRGGGVWISRDGISPYRQLTGKRVYPAVEGKFEDPVVWKDSLQYHLIVNDWLRTHSLLPTFE